MEPYLQARIDKFKSDILHLSIENMIRRHITFGDSFILHDDIYFDLKVDIANHFNVHPNEVLMVGSGKLGFSLVHSKRYRPFCDTSDIDIAIVSASLFDNIWQDVYDYSLTGEYWPKERDFKEFLFKGWIRPDKLPPSNTFDLCNDWWEYFRNISSNGTYGPYKIAAGLYRTWHFLERYHSVCIGECISELGCRE